MCKILCLHSNTVRNRKLRKIALFLSPGKRWRSTCQYSLTERPNPSPWFTRCFASFSRNGFSSRNFVFFTILWAKAKNQVIPSVISYCNGRPLRNNLKQYFKDSLFEKKRSNTYILLYFPSRIDIFTKLGTNVSYRRSPKYQKKTSIIIIIIIIVIWRGCETVLYKRSYST